MALSSAGLRADLVNVLTEGLWQSAQLAAGKPAFEMFAPSALGRAQVPIVNQVRPIAQQRTPTGTIGPQSRSLTIQTSVHTVVHPHKL